MDHIAYTFPEAARAGRASIVTHDDLVAWIKSLPARGKPQSLCLPRDGRSA
jgi:hypothetical protein